MSSSLHEELESQAPQGGNHVEEAPPHWFDPSLALGIKGKGGFGEFRAWGERGGRGSSGGQAGHGVGLRKLVREGVKFT